MPEVDQVIGNREKMDPASYLPDVSSLHVTDIMQLQEVAPQFVEYFHGHTRAFIQMQQGCNHRCTFCIIPFGRGNSQSIPLGHLVNQIKSLQDRGYQEIILTGVDITSYGEDLPTPISLGQAVQRILQVCPDLPRLRISSVDPKELLQDKDLLAVITESPQVMPYIHLSVQAGNDVILKRMKRRHLRDDVYKLCDYLLRRRSDIVFGADIICGFPTETDSMFDDTMNLIRECNIPIVHAFSYSAHQQTPSSKMPQIDKAIRKRRTQELMTLSNQLRQQLYQKNIGKTVTVLAESDNRGYSEQFLPVIPENSDSKWQAGQLYKVMLSLDGDDLIGKSI